MMGYGHGYGYGYGNMMSGGGWFLGLLMFLFFALVIVGMVLLVIWAVRASGRHADGATPPPPGAAGHDEAVAIAKRRLASGEITSEQYNEILRALGG
jgi:putative membrane protein